MRRIGLLAALLACMTGCSGTRDVSDGKPPNSANSANSGKAADPTRLMADANGDFALSLYHQLAKENAGENLFFSPYSVSVALAMAAEGARGETAEQMGRVMRYPEAARRQGAEADSTPWRNELIHAGLADLEAGLNAHSGEQGQLRPYELKIANALWAEQTYPFKQSYFLTIGKYYRTGGVFAADFKGRWDAERKRINGWVEDRTERLIKDLLPEGALDSLTRLVLVNAIYFKGDWDMPFEAKLTRVLDFTRADARKVTTPIMRAPKLDSVRYAAFNSDGSFFRTPEQVECENPAGTYPDSGGFAMAELPYKGDKLSMVVIAPNDPARLAALEKILTRPNLAAWLERMVPRKVDLYLPKFKLEAAYKLGGGRSPGALQRMGMVRAFMDPRLPKGAQFDGMSHATNPKDKLLISLVLHKAVIDVNETGTEAAAATAVVMSLYISALSHCHFTPIFKADRPFIYLIRDRATGSILFLGRMMDPTRTAVD